MEWGKHNCCISGKSLGSISASLTDFLGDDKQVT